MKAGLRQMPDADLLALKEIMTYPKRGRKGQAGERVQKAIVVLFPRLALVDSASGALFVAATYPTHAKTLSIIAFTQVSCTFSQIRSIRSTSFLFGC